MVRRAVPIYGLEPGEIEPSYERFLEHVYLKIDGDFIRSPRSRADDLVVEAIVGIARGLGKRTIAEFVEDAGTLQVMRDHGVDFAQGFHVGHPRPVTELPKAAVSGAVAK